MAVTKEFHSGSVNGAKIQLTLNASPGTLIHTADMTAKDELWLWVANTHGANVVLTLQVGGVTGADNIIATIPFQNGLYLVIPGLILSGGLEVRGFGSVINVLQIYGFVNRIT